MMELASFETGAGGIQDIGVKEGGRRVQFHHQLLRVHTRKADRTTIDMRCLTKQNSMILQHQSQFRDEEKDREWFLGYRRFWHAHDEGDLAVHRWLTPTSRQHHTFRARYVETRWTLYSSDGRGKSFLRNENV